MAGYVDEPIQPNPKTVGYVDEPLVHPDIAQLGFLEKQEANLKSLAHATVNQLPVIGAIGGGAAGGLLGLAGGPPGSAAAGAVGAGLGAAVGKSTENYLKAKFYPDEAPQTTTQTFLQPAITGVNFGLLHGAAEGLQGLLAAKTTAPEAAAQVGKIAEEQGLPPPTFGQQQGGEALQTEQALADIPMYGRPIRNAQIAQAQASKRAIEGDVGDVFGGVGKKAETGAEIKGAIDETRAQTKQTAQQLYDEFGNRTAGFKVNSQPIKDSILDNVKEYKLFSPDGDPLQYSIKSGLKEDQFTTLQNALKPTIRHLSDSPTTDAKELDLIRQILNEKVDFGTFQPTKGDAVLNGLRKNIDDQLGKIAGQFDKEAGPASGSKDILNQGRELWKKQLDLGNTGKNLDLSDERVVSKAFSTIDNIKELKQSVPEDVYNQAATQHAFQTLQQFSTKEGISPTNALKSFRQNADLLKEALGPERYQKLTDILTYMKSTGVSNFNPSKSGLFEVITNPLKTNPAGLTLQAARIGQRLSATAPELQAGAAALAGQQVVRKHGMAGAK